MSAARWRLAAGHYIHIIRPDGTVEGEKTEWEYTEQSRETGRMVRRRFKVPMMLDPRDPADWNYPNQIVVADAFDERYPMDYVMEGEPTADMIPLNPEAKVISDKLAPKWKHPIDSMPGQFSASLLQSLEEQFSKALAQGVLPQAQGPVSLSNADKDRISSLEQLILKQQATIDQLLNGKPADQPKAEEPVYEPLPEIKDPEAPLPISGADLEGSDLAFAAPPVVAPYPNALRKASTPVKRI